MCDSQEHHHLSPKEGITVQCEDHTEGQSQSVSQLLNIPIPQGFESIQTREPPEIGIPTKSAAGQDFKVPSFFLMVAREESPDSIGVWNKDV